MSSYAILATIIIAVLAIWFITVSNKLKRLKVYIAEAWSGIDVQLKRKANIIPNLVDILKMQMTFEKELLVELTNARSGLVSDDRKSAMSANNKFDNIIASIRATVENYPSLATSESFKQLMIDIRDCEDKVGYARNRYNMSVAKYNTERVVFPNNIVASLTGCAEEKMFEIQTPPREIADNLRVGQL